MTTNPTLHSFAYALDFLRDQVAGIAPADMTAQPNGILNHPAWLIGHLTHSCQMLGGAIGLPPWLPEGWPGRYGSGTTPSRDPALYEPKDRALSILADAQARITRAVEQLDHSRLDQPFPDASYRAVFPSIRHALTQVLVGHTAYHIGQLATWRRAMRLPPVGRSFE